MESEVAQYKLNVQFVVIDFILLMFVFSGNSKEDDSPKANDLCSPTQYAAQQTRLFLNGVKFYVY